VTEYPPTPPAAPFQFEPQLYTPPPLPPVQPRHRRLALVLSLAIGIPVLLLAGGAVVVVLALLGTFAPPAPPQLSALDGQRIQAEVVERSDLLAQLDTARSQYRTDLDNWTNTATWAADDLAGTATPSASVANPGGDAMPGDDPYGRAFLDSIGATDVTVLFEAGPENCGYAGTGGEDGYVYAGGCFNGAYPNTLFMAWDPGAEDLVRSIFVHEAMHWYQNENYLQVEYLADVAGIDRGSYTERWEADASCRAVYVHGIPLEEYVGSSSPCTIDGWYEGFIEDYLAGLGAKVAEPDPASYEVAEASRP